MSEKWGIRIGVKVGLVALVLGFAVPVQLLAAGEGNAAISQGFTAQGELARGAVVSFTSGTDKAAVSAATTDSVNQLAGVVADKPLIELSDGSQKTQVVISGTVMALVSDINGEVENGDRVTASPLSGIGMKAVESTQVVGTAQRAFSDAENVQQRQVTNQSGQPTTVRIGLLPVQVNVAYFQKQDDKKSFLPQFMQRFIDAVAGQEVSPVRAFIAIALFIAGIGGVASILYSSVRSSIISIGRNPLAAGAVHRSLFEVAGLVLGILLLMLIAVYLVLVI